MELPSAFRTLVGGHRLLIALCVLLPVLAVGLVTASEPVRYTAVARVQATNATLGSDTEADSVLNLVRGIATSTDVVRRALHVAHVAGRNATDVATHDITLNRLGSSPVIDLGVVDSDPRVAVALAGALADQVVSFLRDNSQAPQAQLAARLRREENALAKQRAQLSARLSAATSPAAIRTLSAQLGNVEQQDTQTVGALQQLEVTMAAASSAAVITHPTDAIRVSPSLPPRLILAALGGLVVGLLIAALRETIKPRVGDARNAARHLDAPLLGALTADSLDALTALSVRRAAERAEVTTLAVAGRRDAETAAALTEHFLVRSLNGLANGAPRGVPNGSTGAMTNGGGPVTAGRSAAGTVAAPTAPKLHTDVQHELNTMAPLVVLRAVALSQIAPLDLNAAVGLLVVVSPRMPMALLTRVRDVAEATGWPIVGVLDAGA